MMLIDADVNHVKMCFAENDGQHFTTSASLSQVNFVLSKREHDQWRPAKKP